MPTTAHTQALTVYSAALLALCPLLDISPAMIQEATGASRQAISNWSTGRRVLQPPHEQALFSLLTAAAQRLPTTLVGDEPTVTTRLWAIFAGLMALDRAMLDYEKAYVQWVQARTAPMLRDLGSKLGDYAMAQRPRQRVLQTMDEIHRLRKDVNDMFAESKTRNLLLRALDADLRSPAIPPTRKVHIMADALVQLFGTRLWTDDLSPSARVPSVSEAGEVRPTQQ